MLFAYTNHSKVLHANVSCNSIGIELVASTDNMIAYNSLTNNGGAVFCISSSDRNKVIYNTMTSNGQGIIQLYDSNNNDILRNTITNCNTGIWLYASYGALISENTIKDNKYGIFRWEEGGGSSIYHNNFINNLYQTETLGRPLDTWDNGYPFGGNYWSDYAGVDIRSGSNQDLPGSDGIGDTPHIIDANNVDHYPLMNPYGTPSVPTYSLTITATVGGTTDQAPGTYSYTRANLMCLTEEHNDLNYRLWVQRLYPNIVNSLVSKF